MHSFIKNLSDKIGVPIVERNGAESWNYDGQTLSSYYYHPHMGTRRIFTDHDLLHELCHWVVAEECQRDLPEYGLALGISIPGAFGPNGGEFKSLEGRLFWEKLNSCIDGLVEEREQEIQERLVQFLCVYIGKKHNLPVKMCIESDNKIFTSWDVYLDTKREEISSDILQEVEKRFPEMLKRIR